PLPGLDVLVLHDGEEPVLEFEGHARTYVIGADHLSNPLLSAATLPILDSYGVQGKLDVRVGDMGQHRLCYLTKEDHPDPGTITLLVPSDQLDHPLAVQTLAAHREPDRLEGRPHPTGAHETLG